MRFQWTRRAIAVTALGMFAAQANAQNYFEDFDSYPLGGIEGMGGWDDWTCNPTGFPEVSTDFALTGTQSLKLVAGLGTGGNTTDLTQTFGGTPLATSGVWRITANVYVPTGFTGVSWYILLNTFPPCGSGPNWSSDITFDANSGMVSCDCGSGALGGVIFGALTFDTWIEIVHEVDLDTDTCNVFYDGSALPVATYQWSNGFPPAGNPAIACIDLFPNDAGAGTIYYDAISIVQIGGDVGTNYCAVNANSTGFPALISATGSSFVADQDLTLRAQPVPMGVNGIFYYGATQTTTPFGNGFRCVGGMTNRLPFTTAMGDLLEYQVDFGLAQAAGIVAGTINFQAWFRDQGDPMFGFQLSDGLTATFQ